MQVFEEEKKRLIAFLMIIFLHVDFQMLLEPVHPESNHQ
jgi:hypothetical protein